MAATDRVHRWREAGAEPLPIDAPSYRIIAGSPLTTIWIAGYHPSRKQAEMLDERYILDRTSTLTPDSEDGFDKVRRGDVLIWIGPDDDGIDTVWQPSVVVDTRHSSDGLVQITSIRDTSLAELALADVTLTNVDPASHLNGGRSPEPVDSSVLDLWQLDVWCPECGHLGALTSRGIKLANSTRDLDGTLLPWPRGLRFSLGCTVPREHLYACERCGHRWGTLPRR